MSVRSTLAAILLAAAALPAAAQSEATTGIIRGTVHGPGGAAVGGAQVLIQHAETGFTTSVETTATGTFARTLLPLGSYELIVTKDDEGLMERLAGLTLRVGESLNLDIALKEVVADEITVSTDAYGTPATEDVTTSQRLADEVIEGLPTNGRNFFDLTLLTPGASLSQGPDGDELNISGQRGIFNNFIVDGADFNNSFFGEQRGGQRPAFTFNQDAIQEMVVINQGATAEFGRSAGGFVNVITKSGTNELEGTMHTFRQWDGISSEHPSGEAAKPEFERMQYGFTLGGPIQRERVFFFGAYDEQDASETKQLVRGVAGPANLARLDRLPAGALARPVRRRVRAHRPHRRQPSPDRQAGLQPERAPPGVGQVQLHLVGAGERNVRRRLLGPVGQRHRAGLLARRQPQPAVPAQQPDLE